MDLENVRLVGLCTLNHVVVQMEDTGENYSQSPPQIDHQCCYGCGDSLDGIFCQRCTCKSCGKGANYGYNCPSKVPIISNLKPCHNQNVEEFPQTLPSFHPTCHSRDENSFAYDSTPNFINDSPNVSNPPSQPLMYSYEFCGNDAHFSYDCPPQVTFIYNPEPCYNQDIPICYDDDDDEESSTPLRDIIISELPPCIAITPILSTKETKDSLIMGDEHLYNILEKESDEFIKSSVENLVSNPSESEDLSNIGRECDVPVCDDFTTFSNSLFDADNFSSSDDESFLDEDILKEIYLNLLFDEEIISIKIDPHHFIDCGPEEEIRLIEELLYDNSSPRPPEEFNSENSDVVIESFSPYHIPFEDSDPFMEEIDLFLTSDGSIPPGIDSDYSDFEGDNLFPEILLHDDLIPLSDILDFSNVVRIFPPLFTYPVTSSILLSSGSEDTIFDPGNSNYHFSSLEPDLSHRSGTFMKFNVYPNHLNESPMIKKTKKMTKSDQNRTKREAWRNREKFKAVSEFCGRLGQACWLNSQLSCPLGRDPNQGEHCQQGVVKHMWMVELKMKVNSAAGCLLPECQHCTFPSLLEKCQNRLEQSQSYLAEVVGYRNWHIECLPKD
uniref:Uncharacterized protein n=1 Tax=Tanacetum cinerariifolium TaxID=118510 RepID=A0A6L2NHT8_TANCI|nr:hypothetical protein [Tanacetum cinerariifolium]